MRSTMLRSVMRAGARAGGFRSPAQAGFNNFQAGIRSPTGFINTQLRTFAQEKDAAKPKKTQVTVKTFPEPRVVGDDLDPTDSRDIAVGYERMELELGIDRIVEPPEGLIGAFGTKEAPYLVESAFDERIVGCTGQAYPGDHEVNWMVLKKGNVTVCPLCHQHYSLKDLSLEE